MRLRPGGPALGAIAPVSAASATGMRPSRNVNRTSGTKPSTSVSGFTLDPLTDDTGGFTGL
ncbi:MAG TPA: hypothetical protein VGN81_07810, partial [Pseudonocardiaceae bacterium]